MGKKDSFYDWEASLKQNHTKTKIGISEKDFKAFLKKWKKENLEGKDDTTADK